MEKTTWVTTSLWMLTLVTLQLAQPSTRNDMAIKDVFQAQLSAVQGNHSIFSPFYCSNHTALLYLPYSVVESDGYRDMLR